MLDGYRELVELARHERDVVREGRYEELAPVARERTRIIAQLPVEPPPEAEPLLRELADLQAATTRDLQDALYEARLEMERIERGRQLAQGYRPGGAPGARIDASG